MLPVISKSFERAVFNRTSHSLEKNNLISEDQYGFRADKSTSDAIMVYSDFVHSILDEGSILVSLFLDFKKHSIALITQSFLPNWIQPVYVM